MYLMNDVEYDWKDGSNINVIVAKVFSSRFHKNYVLLIV